MTASNPSQKSYYIDAGFYESLNEELKQWSQEGISADQKSYREGEALIYREARILDEGRYRDWLDLFVPECLYWIPTVQGGGDPRSQVCLVFDDRRRLEDRVARLDTGYAYSQIPPSRTRRLLTNIEVLEGDSSEQMRVRSNFAIHEFRANIQRTLAGWYGHTLQRDANGWKISRKLVNLIDSDQGMENLSLVL